MADAIIIAQYDREAEALSKKYNSLRFEDIHGPILALLPKPPAAPSPWPRLRIF